MWYIVDAAEGAEIIYGLADGVDSDGFRAAFEQGALDGAMKKIKVKAGQTYFIPAGMVHAIGAGILIAEIQQNSDLTYRVYDYDRVGANGKKRELHVERALDAVRPFEAEEINEKLSFLQIFDVVSQTVEDLSPSARKSSTLEARMADASEARRLALRLCDK